MNRRATRDPGARLLPLVNLRYASQAECGASRSNWLSFETFLRERHGSRSSVTHGRMAAVSCMETRSYQNRAQESKLGLLRSPPTGKPYLAGQGLLGGLQATSSDPAWYLRVSSRQAS